MPTSSRLPLEAWGRQRTALHMDHSRMLIVQSRVLKNPDALSIVATTSLTFTTRRKSVRVSRRNAEGHYIIHKDQPKETRTIGVRTWTRKQWAGRGQVTEVTESVNVERECYPRTFVPPPGAFEGA